jgi:hypothetical protein
MVRARAGILEEENEISAREKLPAAVRAYVPDEREQRLVEPRLAHLLGLEQRTTPDRADLFSGWRLFFERLAGIQPMILAFEDLQWADSGLLDFIDYLLEWSGEFPIFILALGRPELLIARPDWTVTVSLHPLVGRSMTKLLAPVARHFASFTGVSIAHFLDDVLDILLDARQTALLDELSAARPEHRIPILDGQLRRSCGRLHGQRGELADAEGAFSDSVSMLRPAGNPYALARGLLDHGSVLAELGRPTEANSALLEARASLVGEDPHHLSLRGCA